MTTNIISRVMEMCEEYREVLKEAFWSKVSLILEEVFTSSESTSGDKQNAAAKAIAKAYLPGHWQKIADAIGKNYHLISREIEDHFFAECDREVLQSLVAGDEGLIATTFLGVATEPTLSPGTVRLMHLSIDGLSALAKENGEWQSSIQDVADLFEGFCVLKGENGAPASLQQKFDQILGGQTTTAKKVPARQISQPVAVTKVNSGGSAHKAATHNPFSVLSGYKVGSVSPSSAVN